MKKIIALALSLMLLIGCVSALAEAADKHTITMHNSNPITYFFITGFVLSIFL